MVMSDQKENRFYKKFRFSYCVCQKIVIPLQSKTKKPGSLAEWLGTGLQNRLQQFDSARNLQVTSERFDSVKSL